VPWKSRLSTLLAVLTAIYLIGFAALVASYGLSPGVRPGVAPALFLGEALGAGLLMANFGLGGFINQRRPLHVALVLGLVAAWAFAWWMNGRHVDLRRQWFIREGRVPYEQMARQVLLNRSLLSDQSRGLDQALGFDRPVLAATNTDGSVGIRFPGGEGGPRHGYFYYTGPQLTAFPKDPTAPLYHLTNGWYEY
jgi:hypothetical protein